MDDFKKVGDKFDKFFEIEAFDPEDPKHKKIVQKRLNLMMEAPLMKVWLKENILFGKDDEFTFEVTKFLINCSIAFFKDKDFIKNIDFNSNDWINALDMRVSTVNKKN